MNGISTQEASGSNTPENQGEFQWSLEYDELLEKITSSDFAEYDWSKLRRILKYKLDVNIKEYLADPPRPPPATTQSQPAASPEPLPSGGMKIPPFPPRTQAEFASARVGLNSLGYQKSVFSEEEAREMKESIYALIDEFGEKPPFTIQRLCDLLVRPKHHYKTSGKYLRAVERSLLVTSTLEDFPIIPPEDPTVASSPITYSPTSSLREATTPLFSPIPFLHEDARRSRSRSRSPPMSPLELASKRPSSPGGTTLVQLGAIDPITLDAVAVDGVAVIDGPVIGLVDELDDPSPGHMSDHPTALSATTSTPGGASSLETSKPIFGSLEDRFVKSSEGGAQAQAATGVSSGDEMAVDEADEDKENINK